MNLNIEDAPQYNKFNYSDDAYLYKGEFVKVITTFNDSDNITVIVENEAGKIYEVAEYELK